MVKKAKKRGVKPGTKRGKYKVDKRKRKSSVMTLDDYSERILKPMVENFDAGKIKYTPAQPLTLCGQLEDAILLLENRVSNAIAKINSLI